MVGKRFNATVWIFNMKNRFKDEWMDKVVRENNDKVDANVYEFVDYDVDDDDNNNHDAHNDEVTTT